MIKAIEIRSYTQSLACLTDYLKSWESLEQVIQAALEATTEN